MTKAYEIDYFILLTALLIAIWAAYYFYDPGPRYFITLILCAVGLALWLLGKVALGGKWSSAFTKPKPLALVRRGIYAKLRHPIYYGVTLYLISLALYFGNLYLWIAVCLHTLYLIFRRSQEEKLLKEKFGEDYTEYKRASWI